MTTPQTTPELLACPFCGDPPSSMWCGVQFHGADDSGYWGIDCCHCHVHADDEASAVAQWNTRARVTAAPLEGVSVPPGWGKVLIDLAEPIVAVDKIQPGWERRLGWNQALQHVADIFSSLPQAESPQPLALPPGFALVPLEPTPEMLNASGVDSGEKIARKTYIAMVAAAPQPPASALPDTGNVGADPLEGIYKPAAKAAVDTLIALGYKFGQNESGYGLAWNPPATSPLPGRGMVPMTEQEEWDFWDAAGLHCAGYNSAIDSDLITVFIESATDGRWYSDIAKRLGLQESYVELLKEILCGADFCEYGTSPRGAWAIEATFADNLAKLKAWYLGKWNQEFTYEIPAAGSGALGDGGSGTPPNTQGGPE